jgi:predicted DCC family thiol-disulfide oxidoreductase YuxK
VNVTPPPADPVLLYDGDCGFCARSVALVLRHERRHTLRFAALASPFGRRILDRRPELAGVDSMVWVDFDAGGEPRRTRVRSAAALRVCRYLGGAWVLFGGLVVIPRPVRDGLYDLVARHRHRLADPAACLRPSPEQQRRFLDAV